MNRFVEVKNNIAVFQIGTRDRKVCKDAYIACLACNLLEDAAQLELALTEFNRLERVAIEAMSRVTEICRALNGKFHVRADDSEFIELPHGGAVILTPLPDGDKQRYCEFAGRRVVLDLGQPLETCLNVVFGLMAGGKWGDCGGYPEGDEGWRLDGSRLIILGATPDEAKSLINHLRSLRS